jgi:hypothetical protein
MRSRSFTHLYIGVAVLVILTLAHISKAQEMTSPTYKIKSDSINFGGGLSTSSSYKIESTVGEIATGNSTSSTYRIYAGYQQMQSGYIALTAAADVILSPAIGGITGGTSNGSTAFNVTTDNPGGYEVTIKASSSPALQSDLGSFADYTLAGAAPDFTFSIAATDSEFGFSPEGTDIASRYKDSGGNCNQPAGGDTADKCWDPLSTTAKTIVSRSSGNHPNGATTTLKFRAQSGTSHLQVEGVYTATTTITALPL